MTTTRARISWLALLLLLAWPSTVCAHGVLKSAEPAVGARLAIAPTLLRLTFTEAMEAAVARIVLTGSDGTTIPLSPIRRGDSATVLIADIVGPLVAGRYTVVWQGAGRDGHPIHGRYEFTVLPDAKGVAVSHDSFRGTGPVAITPNEHTSRAPIAPNEDDAFNSQSPLFVAIRWLQLATLLTLIGALGFALLVLPRARRRGVPAAFAVDAERDAVRSGRAAAAVLCAVIVLRLIAQVAALRSHDGHAVELAAVIGDTLWGRAWLLQAGAAVAALGGFFLVARARLAGWSVVAISVVAMTLAASLSGHATAFPTQPGVAIIKDMVHVLCVGGWLGTLLLIVVAGIPAALRLAPAERGAAVAATVHAFSPLALLFAGLVVFSGVAAAWAHLALSDDPLHTPYARVLLIKLGVVAVLIALGAFNWRWQRPSLGDEGSVRRMRRSATMELIVAAFVLGVTSVLLATPTPAGMQRDGRDRAVLERGRARE